MSYLHILLLTALLSFPLAQQVNASIDCSEYKMTTSVVYNTLRYDLSNNGYIDPPFVDSIWITDRDTTNYLLVSHAQSMEAIDISMLARGYYLLWVRVGDCLYGARFGKQITASDSCDMYETVSLHSRTSSNQNVLQYWLRNPDNIELPPIDSVWVINPDQEVVLVSYAQPMEDIDISFLPNWVYVLYIQLGECVKSKTFFVIRNQGQALDDIPAEAPVYKIIREGQLLIQHNDKTYTVQGIEIK